MTDLGTLGGSYSIAHGVNDAGQVVWKPGHVLHISHRLVLWSELQVYLLHECDLSRLELGVLVSLRSLLGEYLGPWIPSSWRSAFWSSRCTGMYLIFGLIMIPFP